MSDTQNESFRYCVIYVLEVASFSFVVKKMNWFLNDDFIVVFNVCS